MEYSQAFYAKLKRAVAVVGWVIVGLIVAAVGASVYTVGKFLLGLLN